MTSTQPVWKLVANLGDADPITYGGLFVYTDETGTYPPKCERLEPSGEDDHGQPTSWEIHRFTLEPCTYANGILSDNPYHPDDPAWFADSLDGIASCMGYDKFSLIGHFLSDDPIQRAWAWCAVGDYHGYENLDSYPITFTDRDEIEARYHD